MTTVGRLIALMSISAAVLNPIGASADPGAVDPSFGSGGVVTSPGGNSQALAIQPDGKIVATGGATRLFATVRYHPDGSLDTSFGYAGKVVTPVGLPKCYPTASAITIQPDGRIVVAGSAVSGASCQRSRFMLVRYDAGGELDPTFGGDGIVATNSWGPGSYSVATGVAVQPDGGVVASGWVLLGDRSVAFAVARYLPDGNLDPAFSDDGLVTTDLTGPKRADMANALTLQPDGKILVAGVVQIGLYGGRFALARYGTDGSLDASFGNGGTVVTTFLSIGCGAAEGNAIALQPDGRIVVAGIAGCGHPYFALARYLADGSLDATFGTGGKVATMFEPGNCSDEAMGVAIQSDGKIIAAGGVGCMTLVIGVARYDDHGVLDAAFGVGGKVTTGFGGDCIARATGVAMQPDDKILVTGSANCQQSFVLVRYLPA